MSSHSKNYTLIHKYIFSLEKDVWYKINSLTTDINKILIIIDIIKQIIDDQDYPEGIDYLVLGQDHKTFRIKKTIKFYKSIKPKEKKNGTK